MAPTGRHCTDRFAHHLGRHATAASISGFDHAEAESLHREEELAEADFTRAVGVKLLQAFIFLSSEMPDFW